jgi:hypothetical protein
MCVRSSSQMWIWMQDYFQAPLSWTRACLRIRNLKDQDMCEVIQDRVNVWWFLGPTFLNVCVPAGQRAGGPGHVWGHSESCECVMISRPHFFERVRACMSESWRARTCVRSFRIVWMCDIFRPRFYKVIIVCVCLQVRELEGQDMCEVIQDRVNVWYFQAPLL